MAGCLAALLCGSVMAAGAVPAQSGIVARADEIVASGTCGETLTWTLDAEGTLTISGTGEMDGYRPEKSPWYEQRQSIQSVVIQKGVTSIGDFAFVNCQSQSFTDVIIPDGVTSIGDDAFCFCTSLTTVTIPESVDSIGRDVFCNTPWLKAQQEKNPLVIVNGILIDGTTCTGEVVIPEGVTCIGKDAFPTNMEITSVIFPENLERIELMAFVGCSKIQHIELPEHIVEIGDSAFGGVGIEEPVLDLFRVQTRDDRPISNCVYHNAFAKCAALESITLSSEIHEICEGAFSKCANLKTITILDPGCKISDYAGTISNSYENGKCIYTGVIRGYEGSTAQAYAEKYGYNFEAIGGTSEKTYTVTDAVALQKFLLGISKTGSADLNGDGVTDVFDLAYMKRRLLGL